MTSTHWPTTKRGLPFTRRQIIRSIVTHPLLVLHAEQAVLNDTYKFLDWLPLSKQSNDMLARLYNHYRGG